MSVFPLLFFLKEIILLIETSNTFDGKKKLNSLKILNDDVASKLI